MSFNTSKHLFKKLVSTQNLSNPVMCRFFASKIWASADEAVADIPDGASIAMGGFGLCGLPENLIAATRKKNIRDITVISNEAGLNGHGVDQLIQNRQVKKLV